ncbi:unnamed protein product, partial [Mesorhabditis belari]|uniref:Protein unc-80 homolog n=1 Tax=Mesorhabditis belari TaxID=2138241 RepID=A0AAF3E8S6_9BILA
MHVRYLQHQYQGTVQLLLMPLSTANSIKSHKWASDDEEAELEGIPLPIQTFLWRQTNPFLGAKIGKLHEASCVTFERVVVQNILHGLSPSLSDAIASISRWKFLRAALPHIIQCCGSLLEAHAASSPRNLSPSLSKILYILHWMLLDSATECMDANLEEKDDQSVVLRKQALFSIPSIQLFVYLLAPLAETIREDDITGNIRLESGLKIWQAMWQYRQPDVLCFCAPVKQRRGELPLVCVVRKGRRESHSQAQGIYLGDEPETLRRPSIVPPPKPPRTDAQVLAEKKKRELEKQKEQMGRHELLVKADVTFPRPDTELLIDVGPLQPTRIPPPPQRMISRERSCSVVRSASEYRADGESMEQRPKIPKSHTTAAFDVSPTSEDSIKVLDEVDAAMRFVEDNSLSNIFAASDEAPLVQLTDICSEISMDIGEINETSSCDVVCDKCKLVIYREGTMIGTCKCSRNGKSQLKVVRRDSPPSNSFGPSSTPLSAIPSMKKESPILLCRDETMSSSSQQTVFQNILPQTSRLPTSSSRVSMDKSSSGDLLQSVTEEEKEFTIQDPTVASYLDVAVIRTLLIRHWSEEGIYWAMRYLLNRLTDIQSYVSGLQWVGHRGRSNSLPPSRKHTQQLDQTYLTPTWADLQLESDEERSKPHVAFKDTRRRLSSDQGAALRIHSAAHESRRASLNTTGRRLERNKSDPSLNSSLEVLSIREQPGSTTNLSKEDKEKEAEKIAAKFYPEALGSTNFIEKDGHISYIVIVHTVDSVMERNCSVRLCELALNIADTLLRTPAEHEPDFFAQLSNMVFRIYHSLGCPHGCSEGVKSAQGDFLRAKARALFASLERLDGDRFRTLIQIYVQNNPPQQVLDLLHSITAFCRSEFSSGGEGRRESRAPSYRNQFCEKDKGIEGRILNATFKPLVTRLVQMGSQLQQPENMSLYGDVRMLVNFVQEQHGNPFRRVGLSALIDAIIRPNGASSSNGLRLTIPHIALDSFDEAERRDGEGSGKSSPSMAAANRGEQASLRRGLFKKKEKLSGADESDWDSSPSTPRTMSSVDDTPVQQLHAHTLKKKSAPKLHFAFNLLKTNRTDNVEEECSDLDAEGDDEEETPSKKTSIVEEKPLRRPPTMSGALRLWGVMIPAAKTIDLKAIADGARRFAFLLETARPGTFPDPSLTGAIIQLKSPVVARASLLLELAHFVNRCNRGDWPDWIRSSHARTFSLGGPLANRGTPSATRRMHTLQRTAGRYFYQWALHIGEQLARLLEKGENREKRELKMGDVMEDFLDDATVNSDEGERVPFGLQLVAVMLLLEITSFLREYFRTIPRGKPGKGGAPSGWDRLLSHRRWSILSNTFNPQQTGSISSIADAVPGGIHLNEKERRISLSTAEEDSPRGSKDTIEQDDKKGSRRSARASVRRAPSTRLFSRQSTHDDSASSTTHGSTRSAAGLPPPVPVSSSFTNAPPTAPLSDSGRRLATGRQRLLKRGSPLGATPNLESSNKRRQQASFRLRKASKPPMEEIEKDPESQVLPAISASGKENLRPTMEEAPVSPSCDPVPTSSQTGSGVYQRRDKPASHDDEEEHMANNMPWLKIVMKFTNSLDLDCNHESACSPRCFERIARQCNRLLEAVAFVYGDKKPGTERVDRRRLMFDKWNLEQQHIRRSLHSRQSAAVPRRESAMTGVHSERSSMAIKTLLMEKMLQEKAEKEKEKEKEDSMSKKISVQEADRISEEVPDVSEMYEKNQEMLAYLRNSVLGLVHSPLSISLKSALLLSTDNFRALIGVSWKLLLNEDPHVVVAAASMFIVASVKRSDDAVTVIRAAIDSTDPTERAGAVQRFYALWRNRFHVWLKMEDGAQTVFKVPPPGIDFTLPSPPIGQSQLAVVDPPWMPHLKTKVEELSLKEEEHQTSQTIMTMTRTRRKQKQEMVKRAVREAEERQCEQRQAFQLRGSAIVQQGAYEPALFHHQQETNEENEAGHGHPPRHVLPVAQPLFPSALLSVVPQIIELLDDPQVDKTGVSVGDVAKKVIWACIVEEPSLFLRHFLERLTNRDRQEHLISLLRKLILRFKPFPSQAAYSLLNYLFGFVMHYVRSACEGADKALGMALSLTWLLAPHVNGLYFKDLKQTLKKEQCDQALMITANVPSAKKIVVHGPDSGEGGIPSQFPVHEDTQFIQILTDSLEFFNIEEELDHYFLADAKTGVLHVPSAYVRDFYFFHRSFYPQLTLLRMGPEEAARRMKASAFAMRFIDVGKVLLTHNILSHSPPNVIAQRIFFLHDELTHLPSFPRKALEACFGMYYGDGGLQLKEVDAMHKFVWAKMMSDMFEKMENAFMFADLHLFINVVNGIMIMHCEDILILRRCAATYITMSIHFNTLFASQGFFLIMPTLLRCYSQRQTNRVFCGVVEFLCRQFYTLHRKPFMLQMCGSVATILDHNNDDFQINPMRVKAKYWFALLKAMEDMNDESDPLDILGLVPHPKPLKALDLCYRDDANSFCLLTDGLASCICVCAFSPEGKRSHHMLLVMQALLPHIIRRAEEESLEEKNGAAAIRREIQMHGILAVEMKTLINSCEALARGPQRTFDLVNSVSERGKSFIADSPQFFDPPTTNDDETIAKPYNFKEKKSTVIGWEAADVEEQQKETYRRPRDTLLTLAATYIELATPRLKELTKLAASLEHVKIPDVLDHKCHVKLSEIALALLKIAPYDLNTMSCIGLQKYFLHVLPVTDWSIEANRSALNIVLRRLDKTIAKIAKKQSIRRRVSWTALAHWLNGLCDTLSAFPYIAHLHALKTTTQMCVRIMVGDPCSEEGSVPAHPPSTILYPSTPQKDFCQATLRLTTILMQALGQFAFSLEQVCSVEGMGVSAERVEAVLVHVLIPLFLRAAIPSKEASVIKERDLIFCLALMQNAISPPIGKQSQVAPLVSTSTLATTFIRGQGHDLSGRQGSVSVTDRGHSATVSTHRIVRESVCQSVFLALKVMMLCFGRLLGPLWPRVNRLVKDLLNKKAGGQAASAFVEFVLHSNLPISLLILPTIHAKVKNRTAEGAATAETSASWVIEMGEKLSRIPRAALPLSVLIHRCTHELIALKEDFSTKPLEVNRSYTPTMADPHSDSSTASLAAHKTPLKGSTDRRASSGLAKARLGSAPQAKDEMITGVGSSTIPEDVEDEGGEVTATSAPRVTKSPSVPLNKFGVSPRTRSMSGFGVWRSVRRRSRNVSTESEAESERGVEMSSLGPSTASWTPLQIAETATKTELATSLVGGRRSTEGLVLPLDTQHRHRFVSFSTPKTGRKEEETFQIIEHQHVV